MIQPKQEMAADEPQMFNKKLASTGRDSMLRLVTDSVPVLISYIDAEQTFCYCNALYEDWFGLTKDQVIGQQLREVVGESAWRTIEPQVNKVLAGERVEFSACLPYRYGPEKCVTVQYEPHLSEDGAVAGFIAFVQDQTDRVEREKTMARLAAIVDSSHHVITGISHEGIITAWNKGAEDLYGYRSDEAVGAHFSLIVPQALHRETAALYERTGRGEYVAPFETMRCTKDGSTKNILMSLSPIRIATGEILGISAVAHDITDRIVAEQNLAEMNEHLETRVTERTEQLRNLTARFLGFEQTERRKFSQFLHDEIQQTLAAAKLLIEQAQLSADQEKTLPPLSESLRLLNEAIGHTRSITMDLSPPLFFDTGISACLNWLERWAQAKCQLQVTVSLQGRDRAISEETGYLLYRCLRELLFNIYKHAGVKEALLSAVFENDGTLRFSVADRGTGFDPQTLKKPVDKHFGLLSLIEQVEAIKGCISIDSGSGSGTKISISLPPAALAPPPPVPSLPGTRQQPDLIQDGEQMDNNTGKPAILIVDDQEDLRYTLRLMLEDLSSKYLFLEAERAEQAVDMVRQYQPQLVLMDVSMPGLSGVEATRMIKAEFDRTVVIGLSMHEREDMEKAMREAGAAEYLTKDSASEVILSTIEDCLAAAGS